MTILFLRLFVLLFFGFLAICWLVNFIKKLIFSSTIEDRKESIKDIKDKMTETIKQATELPQINNYEQSKEKIKRFLNRGKGDGNG